MQTDMLTEKIPTAISQVVLLMVLILCPLLIAALIMLNAGPVRASDRVIANGLLLLSAITPLLFGFLMLGRRTVAITTDALTIRHTFYRISIQRTELQQFSVRLLEPPVAEHLAIKTNGIAAFGFYSGWFSDHYGKKVFCAVSGQPVYLLELAGHPRLDTIIMSATPAVFQALQGWMQD